ncbi:MAG: HNH endonuclease [Acetobacteraceae bacterium]|nr:HNH endonuclease [Acetobacteraceae bacterium]
MSISTTAEPAPAPCATTEPKARQRRPFRRGKMPADVIATLLPDGRTVRVALYGSLGAGKSFLMDAADWQWISPEYGPAWLLNANGDRTRAHVRRAGHAVAAAARQCGEKPVATLARIITGAGPGEVVLYRNGDTLDLRRVNLEVVSRAEAARRCRQPR